MKQYVLCIKKSDALWYASYADTQKFYYIALNKQNAHRFKTLNELMFAYNTLVKTSRYDLTDLIVIKEIA